MTIRTKTFDAKGRVTLGKEFAGRTVNVEGDESGIHMYFVTTVPLNEEWLWKNAAALEAVRQGLEQAAAGELTDGPEDLEGAFAFADEIPDEDE